MLYDFEKILKENNFSEQNTEMPKAIGRKIEKFRATQKKLQAELTDDEKEEILKQLDQLDEDIMKTLPDFFDIEDEEEKKKAEAAKLAKEKAEKEKAEKEANAKKQAEENSKPAANDDEALEKLHQRGLTEVTVSDLKKAGFNTGFWGDLTPTGCSTKRFKLVKSVFEEKYRLIKK